MKLINGAKYKFESKNISSEGLFISENENSYFFKQDSGYNIGVDKKSISKITKIKDPKPQKKEDDSKVKNPDVLILHTGGTIASKVDYSTGAVSDKFSPKEILGLFPELNDFGVFDSKLISNMPSDDMNFNHYNILIDEVVKNHEKVKGIIITHGTDTIHFTSAALSFALQGIKIPVVLVGSQRSSDRPSSDAANNLLNAAYFIKKQIPGVYVCMHEDLRKENCLVFKGINLKKMHSSARDAFSQINKNALARINFKQDLFEKLSEVEQSVEFNPKKFNSKLNIGMIYARSGMLAKEVKLFSEGYDGLVLVGTGLGHFPITKFDSNTVENKKIFDELEKLSKKIPLVMTTQTIYGKVNLNVYSPGRKLKKLGILGHDKDLIAETAYIKLAFLLSNYKKEEIKDLY
ncbi:MAG: Glu-tRNA(Gln) amidotransferase subunit GatD [Candidatus Woesearchaeota archaeon]